MGKKDSQYGDSFNFRVNDKNQAINPSLSYTLNHFVSFVQIQKFDKDCWKAFKKPVFYYKDGYVYSCPSLSQFLSHNPYFKDLKKNHYKMYYSKKEFVFSYEISLQNQKKFIDFFQYLKKVFYISGNYEIRSVNNFPLSAGVASSASSFSALVLATYQLAKDHSSRSEWIESLTLKDLSRLGRLGSGSACRSFFSPWSLWQGEQAESYKNPFDFCIHQLLLISDTLKTVSSRNAHAQVLTSPFFKRRPQRAQLRLKSLNKALQSQDWRQSFLICWEEFQDMHHLFETSKPPFSYRNKLCLKALSQLKDFWREHKDGPLVTMDAGSNLHLIYRQDQKAMARQIENLFLDLKVLSSDVKR